MRRLYLEGLKCRLDDDGKGRCGRLVGRGIGQCSSWIGVLHACSSQHALHAARVSFVAGVFVHRLGCASQWNHRRPRSRPDEIALQPCPRRANAEIAEVASLDFAQDALSVSRRAEFTELIWALRSLRTLRAQRPVLRLT